LAVAGASASAQERGRLFKPRPACPPDCQQATPYCPAPFSELPTRPDHLSPPPGTPGTPTDPSAPQTPESQAAQPPTSSFDQALASTGEGGTQPGTSYAPGMFGDQGGPVFGPSAALLTGLKVSETDSPRPMDRVYYSYSGYYNLPPINFLGPQPVQLHRHLFGFEKTLLGGDASVGMRIPYLSVTGDPNATDTFFNDLTVVLKYALINNRDTGNVLSLGMTVTAPTGGSIEFFGVRQPRNNLVYMQPYFGYIYNLLPRLYVHGFHGVAVPAPSAEATFMTNDVGLGFYLLRNPEGDLLRAIVPTFEVHVNTPFNHRGTQPNQILDSVNLTSGVYALFRKSQLGASVSVPVAYGPYKIEALASYTYRFGRNEPRGLGMSR